MSRSGVFATVLLFVLALPNRSAAFPLAAGSLRCGARIVGAGQTTRDVSDLCGEPSTWATATDYVTVRVSRDVAVTRAVVVERWTYDRGPHQFLRYLTFRDGVLVAIDEGSYGD